MNISWYPRNNTGCLLVSLPQFGLAKWQTRRYSCYFFPRGASAVRALARFIHDVEILSLTHLALLPMIYALWRKQDLEQL